MSAALLSASGCATPEPRQACMAGLTRALTEGGFSGPILCADADASFDLAGRVGEYSVYDYRYRYRPLHGAVDHGGQRILIFRGETYLGQYSASPPPYVSVSVQGSQVSFGAADSKPLDLSNGPPADTVLSGQDVSFFR
ncbi:MAG: hypothetical protein EON87_07255 [Brevundimonas sp.]|nr:MAG: hypothetical protein EON87_07255 [Brevundimonas sp.]